MKTFFLKITSIIALILLIQSCDLIKKDEVKPVSNDFKINMGAFTQLNSTNISTNGGTVTVNTGDLSGLKITVPKSAYTSSRQFIVSTSDASTSEFGKYLKPLTPFIKVENGGGYAKGIMFLKIPAKVPQGQFPMAYFVDAANGKLEPIPVEYYDDNSVTITTRHFSSSTLMNSQGLKKARAGEGFANIMISSIAESVFKDIPVVNSGFKLGTDDWEFVNYGSYIAPGGHCAGQNFAAMWYYFEKKKTEGNLFNKFNTTSNIQEENALGYKMSSVIQNDLEWEGTLNEFYWNNIDLNRKVDKLKMYSIAGAILTTGEPQAIGIYRVKGIVNGFSDMGGHALICYKVDIASGKLYISDPNTPNTAQSISFAGERFNPYYAKANGHDSDHSYPYITHHAKTAHIEWNKIGTRWGEVVSKKIGSVAPNKFPEYTLWNNDLKLTEVKDSISVSKDTLRLLALSDQTERWYANKLNGKKAIGLYIYDENGNQLIKQDGTHKKFILLKPGVTKLGVYVYAWRNNNIKDELYIDFKWIKVNYEKLAKFEWWLTGYTEKVDYDFGTIDLITGFVGSWTGNTFKVNKTITDAGKTVNILYTFNCNANKTIINTFQVETWKFNGSQKYLYYRIEGKNLPQTSVTSDMLYFGATGTVTCNYIDAANSKFWLQLTSWGCESGSFLKIEIPKP